MNITKDVILDLLPLFYSDECSKDTKLLIEEFFKTNPEFEKQAKRIHNPFPATIPQSLKSDDELKVLSRTRALLRWRSYVMAAAIFCSLVPFSFLYTQGKIYWLFAEAPGSATVYGILGILFWGVYVVMKLKSKDL